MTGITVGIASKPPAVSSNSNSNTSTGTGLPLTTRTVIPCPILDLPLDTRSTCPMDTPLPTYPRLLSRLDRRLPWTGVNRETILPPHLRLIITTIRFRTPGRLHWAPTLKGWRYLREDRQDSLRPRCTQLSSRARRGLFRLWLKPTNRPGY